MLYPQLRSHFLRSIQTGITSVHPANFYFYQIYTFGRPHFGVKSVQKDRAYIWQLLPQREEVQKSHCGTRGGTGIGGPGCPSNMPMVTYICAAKNLPP